MPIVIFWNNDIMFQEVYRAIRMRLRADIGSVSERPGAAVFFIGDYPAIRFFRDPEFCKNFSAKTVIDTSIYKKTLEKHMVEQDRQYAIEAIAARFNAVAMRVRL